MSESLIEGDDESGHGLGLRTVLALVAVLVGSLVAGVLVWGTGTDAPPTVSNAATGCTVEPLRFTVTNDPKVFAAQQQFEQGLNAVPKPGYYDRVLDSVPTLHAASHSFVVVYVGDGVDGDATDSLKALAKAAVQTKAPVIVSKRAQQPALVALSRGYQLTCPKGTVAQAAEVRRFAAQEYASVADPQDAGTAPAPTSPNMAPSPIDPVSPSGSIAPTGG